jgi:hypothetical protein
MRSRSSADGKGGRFLNRFIFAGELIEGGREKKGVPFRGIGGVSIVAATPLEFDIDPEAYFEFRNDGFGYPCPFPPPLVGLPLRVGCVVFDERLSSY